MIFSTTVITFGIGLVALATAQTPDPRFTTKKYATVSGSRMAYVEVGSGDPIVLLHGNPTSSYLWRNVMPHLEPLGRVIAPDLIGFGDSDKLRSDDPLRYSFLQHSNFVFQMLETIGVKRDVTLVLHDWGSAIGFLWAYYRRFDPRAVKAIVFLEAVVEPIQDASFLPPVFFDIRGALGEELVLQQNLFIESLLPGLIIRNLTDAEMDEYRRPFRIAGEDRRPALTFPRQVPINGIPADVTSVVAMYSTWLKETKLPKLFISGNPGLLLAGERLAFPRSFQNLKEVIVPGLHYLQEDSPNEIGRSIVEWLPTLNI